MGTKYTLGVKVTVDGFVMSDLYDVTLDHGTYHDATSFEEGAMYRAQMSNVRARLTATDGTKLEFRVQGYEQEKDVLHFYGPLRALFPEMFADIDPLPWQEAYLISMARPAIDRFKMRRTDDYFTGDRAIAFRLGWEAGSKAGAETERKLAKIAADGLKNPPQSKDNREYVYTPAAIKYQSENAAKADYVGVLGEALKNRKGK